MNDLVAYLPVLGGLLTLVGVGVTLWVTGRREARRSRREREDEHRADVRRAVVNQLTASRTAQRFGRRMADYRSWMPDPSDPDDPDEPTGSMMQTYDDLTRDRERYQEAMEEADRALGRPSVAHR